MILGKKLTLSYNIGVTANKMLPNISSFFQYIPINPKVPKEPLCPLWSHAQSEQKVLAYLELFKHLIFKQKLMIKAGTFYLIFSCHEG